ncbi:MAG: FUSC family protein [Andreesenia angusta]|nr:FUSC family protein [Andreesenia angusta]
MLKRLKMAFPTAIVLWISFIIILKLFGSQFAILGFYMSLFYLIRSYTKFEYKKYLKDVSFQFILAILAVLASQNAILQFIMNAIIVFFIAYVFFSQASPTGYIIYFIEFIFLQLRPLELNEIPKLSLLLIVFYIIIFIVFFIRDRFKNIETEAQSLIDESLNIIIEYLESLNSEKFDNEIIDRMDSIISSLYDSFHNSMIFPSKIKRRNITEYYMIVILKRVKIFHEVLNAEELRVHREYIYENISILKYLKENLRDNREEALNKVTIAIEEINPEDEFVKRNFAGILLFLKMIIIEDYRLMNSFNSQFRMNISMTKEFIKNYKIKLYFQMNEFRFAFALRLATVTSLTMLASSFISTNYSYWLPINAVFLVKPLYEESRIYIKNRLIGTLVGSIVLAILLSQFGTKAFCFAVFFISSYLFYATPANNWTRNLWSTLFGTSLVAISLGVGKAIELKIFYIILASLVALFANRFFLPKDRLTVYRNNYKNIGIVSLDQIDNIFNTNNLEQSFRTKKILFNFMQNHYTLKHMFEYIDDIKDLDEKKYNMTVYDKLTTLAFSLEKAYFLSLSTNKKIKEEKISKIKDFLDRFIYEVNRDIRDSEKTLDSINQDIDIISEELKYIKA